MIDAKRCRWCGRYFFRRSNERPSAFARRQHCDRACQVSTQNSERARRNRRANGIARTDLYPKGKK